jgi:hypothetical protein
MRTLEQGRTGTPSSRTGSLFHYLVVLPLFEVAERPHATNPEFDPEPSTVSEENLPSSTFPSGRRSSFGLRGPH